MKVLHVISCLVEADGHALFCGRLAAELQGKGIVNRILTCPHVDGLPLMTLSQPDVEVRVIQGRVRRLLNIVWVDGLRQSIKSAIARSEPDIVHVHGFWHPVVHYGVMTAKRFGIPVVLSPQGSLTPWAMRFRAWKKWLAWWGYQRRSFLAADVYHACSSAEAADLKRLRVRRPICTVPIGCDMLSSLKAALPSERIRTVLFLGRLHPKKGADLLIDACGRLKRNALMRYCENAFIEDRRSETGGQRSEGRVKTSPTPDWQFVIAGPDEQGTRSKLIAQAEKLGLRVDEKYVNKVITQSGNQAFPPDLIFTGPLYGEEKAQVLAAADLFVLPSLSENFGSVVLEALACGVPVICTKGAPWGELVTERCGWWVDVGVTPLAGALREAMGLTDEKRRAMGENGRRLVEAKYQWPSIAARMAQVYEECRARIT